LRLPNTPLLANFQQLRDINTDDLKRTAFKIGATVDFDQSLLDGRVVVRHGVHQDLDELKNFFNALDDFLVSSF
jgi:hypothetical protein